MKKIFAVLILLFVGSLNVYAKNSDNYSLNFDGQKYVLLYSVKNKELSGYLNEYYKQGESYNIWTEMIGIHHFPNAYSPIDQIKMFKEYLGKMNVPSSLSFDDKKNTAMIDFIMINDKRNPVILEFNVFKYQKSKECGSVAVQYAKRYTVMNALQAEQVKASFEKTRKHILKKINSFDIPDIITKDIDKCKYDIPESVKEQIPAPPAEELAIPEAPEEQEVKSEETVSSETSEEIKEPEQAEPSETSVKEEKTEEDIKKASEKISDKAGVSEEKSEEVNKTEIIKEPKETKAEKTEIVPIKSDTKEKTPKNEKVKKQETYQIIDTKDEYIAKPRTNKELKQHVKELKQIEKNIYEVSDTKDNYISKPRTPKELKRITKQIKKEKKEKIKRAKKAKKKLRD